MAAPAVKERTMACSNVFEVQILQLLLRACRMEEEWIKEDFHSLVPHVLAVCSGHRIPIVRLGCVQTLSEFVHRSSNLLMPFKKQVEATLRKACNDRRREVRLLA